MTVHGNIARVCTQPSSGFVRRFDDLRSGDARFLASVCPLGLATIVTYVPGAVFLLCWSCTRFSSTA